jgi:hypothetical protein
MNNFFHLKTGFLVSYLEAAVAFQSFRTETRAKPPDQDKYLLVRKKLLPVRR